MSRTLRSDSLLLVAAFIWGTTFVAQRKGMDHIGPMTYNALRFIVGAGTLLPLILRPQGHIVGKRVCSMRFLLCGGALAGLALFGGASLQQMGLQYTTAGKAGFVTSLYVVLVPLMGLTLGHRAGLSLWIGIVLTVTGLYLLSVTESFAIARGDLLVLGSAFFWALHVHVIGYLAQRANPVRIACVQFVVCSVVSGVAALCTESGRASRHWQGSNPHSLWGHFLGRDRLYTPGGLSADIASRPCGGYHESGDGLRRPGRLADPRRATGTARSGRLRPDADRSDGGAIASPA